MGRISHIRSSFLGGEIDPESYGRIDLPQYPHCHEILQNVLTMPQGPATRRPGTGFVDFSGNELLNRNDDNVTPLRGLKSASYPFIFSQSESYVVELYNIPSGAATYIRVRDANAPFDDVDGLSINLDFLVHESHLPFFQRAQSADVMWLVHPMYEPIIIYRTESLVGSVTFSLSSARSNSLADLPNDFGGMAQPYRDANTDTNILLVPSGTTGNITISCQTALAQPHYLFNVRMIGAYFKITQTNAGNRYTGCARITAMSGTDNGGTFAAVTATVVDAFVNTTADSDWEEGAWSNYRGWPRTVALFEGRIYFGGNDADPDRVHASEDGNYWNLDARGFSPGASGFPALGADSPFNFVPNSGEVNELNFLSPGKTLLAGTAGREFVLYGPDATLGMSVSNIKMSPETAHGSAYVQPSRVAYAMIFVQPSGKKLRELVFDFNSDSYQGTDIGKHASHLLERRVMQVAWQEEPFGILWCRMEDGSLVSVTRDRQQQIVAFCRHSIAGTNAIVTSICVVPVGDGLNRLFMTVDREVDGEIMRTLEYLDEPRKLEVDGRVYVDNANCLDAHLKMTAGAATATWAGFDHLIGETVRVVGSTDEEGAEPNIEGDFEVNEDGEIELNREVRYIIAGLAYDSKIRTLRAEGGAATGTSQGEMKRTDKILLRVCNTFGLSYGSNDDNQKQINFWSDDRPDLVRLFTGDKPLEFPNGWDRDGRVQLESDSPFPFTVNFIVSKMVVNEM